MTASLRNCRIKNIFDHIRANAVWIDFQMALFYLVSNCLRCIITHSKIYNK